MKVAIKLEEENTAGYGIPSGRCLKIYPDGRLDAMGGSIAVYLKQGNKAEKQPDLLPQREATI